MDETTIRIVIGAVATVGTAFIMIGGSLVLESVKYRFVQRGQRSQDERDSSAARIKDRADLRDDLMDMVSRLNERVLSLEEQNRELSTSCIDLRSKISHVEIEGERTRARLATIIDQLDTAISRAVASIAEEFRPFFDKANGYLAEMRQVLHPDTPIGGPELMRKGIPAAAQPTMEHIDAIRKKAEEQLIPPFPAE